MAKIKRFTEADGGYHWELGFMCPGCGDLHFINDSKTKIPNLTEDQIWEFNGNYENPTIRKSVLTRNYLKNPNTGRYDIENDRCHSFITDGMIQFFSDCHHPMAGLTVELPEIK